jgi:hypothetical protein
MSVRRTVNAYSDINPVTHAYFRQPGIDMYAVCLNRYSRRRAGFPQSRADALNKVRRQRRFASGQLNMKRPAGTYRQINRGVCNLRRHFTRRFLVTITVDAARAARRGNQ